MKNRRLLRDWQFWLAVLLVLATAIASIGNYFRWWDLHFYIGPYYFHHWVGWAGGVYIAVFTPVYSVLKHRSPHHLRTLVKIHTFGNLIAFLLIAIHFTQQVGRPPEFAPVLGTGLALFIIVALIVFTGFMNRFRLASALVKTWRFIHVGLSLSFYIVLLIHVLHNVGAI